MRYTRGDQLPIRLQAAVLARYVHRWTVERQTQLGQCPACAQVQFPYVTGQALPDGPKIYTREQWHRYHVPLVTDAQWLRDHAFRVTRRGELDARQTYAHPAYFAETET